jgi:glutaredoxin
MFKTIEVISRISHEEPTAIVIFGLDSCMYCKKAVQFCKLRRKTHYYFSMENLDPSQLRELSKMTKHAKTVPHIFIQGLFIGGFSELSKAVGQN